MTALLQRKSSWVPADVARFTELYAAEHAADTRVIAAKMRHARLSDEAEAAQLKLLDLIRERYQQVGWWWWWVRLGGWVGREGGSILSICREMGMDWLGEGYVRPIPAKSSHQQ